MAQGCNNISPENNDIHKFRRKSGYENSEKYTKHYKKIKFNSDCRTGSSNDDDYAIAENNAELIDHIFAKNDFLQFFGPTISAKCTISNIKETDFERDFGYIQTSKIFNESEYEHGIKCSDFHANLLRKQDEVLDRDSEDNLNKPFYSKKSHAKVPAGEIPLTKREIEKTLSDTPIFKIIKLDQEYGRLKTHERYVQFFDYLIMRSKLANGEWKYDMLDKFHWFIYFHWSDENKDDLEYNYGFIDCDKTDLDLRIFDDDCKYICNSDEVRYWIDLRDGSFHIINDLNYFFEETNVTRSKKRKCEDTFSINFRDAVLQRNKKEEILLSEKKDEQSMCKKSKLSPSDAAMNRNKKRKYHEAGSSQIH